MENSAKNILEKAQEAFSRQIPREDAKKIAKVATVIISVVALIMSFMILTAESRMLGEWKSRLSYYSAYTEPGYYYIDLYPNGDCSLNFDIEDSILGWGEGGKWVVHSRDLSGINISITSYHFSEPTIFHYNPFTNKLTMDSVKFKRIG